MIRVLFTSLPLLQGIVEHVHQLSVPPRGASIMQFSPLHCSSALAFVIVEGRFWNSDAQAAHASKSNSSSLLRSSLLPRAVRYVRRGRKDHCTFDFRTTTHHHRALYTARPPSLLTFDTPSTLIHISHYSKLTILA